MAFSFRSLSKQNLAYQVINPENPNGPINPIYRQYTSPTAQTRTALITDRKIYRPGQTVYYKGISWSTSPDTLYALENRKYKISFKDANDKEIAQQEVTSNRYGSFTGSFVIPARILNGYFTLYTEKGQTTIEVADYKRPEFEILFQEPTRSYFAGDVVCLKGQVKSFSGVKMAHTPINYTISVSSPIVSPYIASTFHGTTHSNTEGCFEITFKAQDIPATSAFRNSYLYEIKVKVTDTKGETEEMSTMLPIYSGKATPTLQLPEQVNKQQRTAFHISLAEIANDSNAYPVKYTIQKLVSPQQLQTYPDIKDTIVEKTILEVIYPFSGKILFFRILTRQASGIYLLTVTSGQSEAKQIFYLYSPQDSQPPFPTYEWVVREKTTCRPGETARILFGTSAKEAYVRYDIYTSDKLIKRSYPILSNEVIPIDIPFLEEYGQQIWLYISYVKDKKFFSQVIPHPKGKPDRKLTVETKFSETILSQDNRRPETSGCRRNRKTGDCRVIGYDVRCLSRQNRTEPFLFPADLFKSWHTLRLDMSIPLLISTTGLFCRIIFSDVLLILSHLFLSVNYRLMYLHIPIIGFQPKALGNTYMTGSAKLAASDFAEAASDEAGSSGMPTPEINYRENFQETAFFYPQLQTDPEGYVDISFTIPDATTPMEIHSSRHDTRLTDRAIIRNDRYFQTADGTPESAPFPQNRRSDGIASNRQ